jgi:hypothetical protein
MMCLRRKISREMRADPFVLESNGVNDVGVGGRLLGGAGPMGLRSKEFIGIIMCAKIVPVT